MGIIDRVKNLASGAGEEIPLQEYDKNVIPSRDQPSADIDVVSSDIETPPAWFEPSSYEIGDEPVSVPKSEKDIDVIPSKKFTKQTPFFIKEPYVQGEETPSEQWAKRTESVVDGEQVEFNPDGTIKSKPTETKQEESTPESPEPTTTETEPLEYPKDDTSKSTERTWTQQQAADIKEKLKEKFAVKNVLKTGGNVIFGSPIDEVEYSRKGGYIGEPKGTLLQKNSTLESKNEQLQTDLDESKDRIKNLIEQRNELERKPNRTPQEELQLRSIKDSLRTEIQERDKIEKKISDNKELIGKNNTNIYMYDEAVRKGKQESATRSVVGKKLSAIGQNTKEEVMSGVYSGKLNKNWFDKNTGFLTPPYMKSTSPVEPVRSKSANLNAYTRMTGQSVGRSMADAVTTVRANKNIAPLGVPGTVAGAKNQFDYNIPAKRIGLGDINTANINRDILPSIYDSPKPIAQPVMEQQYKQVIQQDGTMVNVPVPTQMRRSKIVTVSVNRYSPKTSVEHGGKTFITGSSKLLLTSKSFGFGEKKFVINKQSFGNPIEKSKPKYTINNIKSKSLLELSNVGSTLGKLSIGIDNHSKGIKSVTIGNKRPNVNIDLINIKQTGVKINKPQTSEPVVETVIESRKSKNTLPMVNINFSKNIGKNIDKVLKNQKKK